VCDAALTLRILNQSPAKKTFFAAKDMRRLTREKRIALKGTLLLLTIWSNWRLENAVAELAQMSARQQERDFIGPNIAKKTTQKSGSGRAQKERDYLRCRSEDPRGI
jgi:hypothetical protein